ncbi:MAG: HAMP domain-containing histidine kinase [Chloroflexi bacterium]|nr:HAMP domain-containing histidine kinase [Chloroflexota bacterium]
MTNGKRGVARQPGVTLNRLLQRVLTPQSLDRSERFRERNIRVMTALGLCFYAVLLIAVVVRRTTSKSFLPLNIFAFVFPLAVLVIWATHTGRILLAGRLVSLAALSILLDTSMAYWSPGTVLFSLVFTFVFMLVLPNKTELIIAAVLNFAIYGYIVLAADSRSPLSSRDFFSEPLLALLIMALCHGMILGIGYYLRRDQAEHTAALLSVEQDRTNMLRQFLRNVSHDLRTPITNVKLAAYSLKQTATEPQQPRLMRLESSLDRLENIMHDILEMSQLATGLDYRTEVLDLRTLVPDVVSCFASRAAKKNQVLSADISDTGEYTVVGDRAYLQRALGNIIANAVMYTPEAGTITVRLDHRQRRALIEISDTGIGIAPHDLPQIFDPFYRVDAARGSLGKSGLGLTITKQIIEKHQGEIRVESQPGQGTTFCVILPLKQG